MNDTNQVYVNQVKAEKCFDHANGSELVIFDFSLWQQYKLISIREREISFLNANIIALSYK